MDLIVLRILGIILISLISIIKDMKNNIDLPSEILDSSSLNALG